MQSFRRPSVAVRQQHSPPSVQESILFGDAAGGHVRFTLGPALQVRSAELLVRDAPEAPRPAPSWQELSMARVTATFGRLMSTENDSETDALRATWRPIPSVMSNPERGVYVVRPADSAFDLRQLVTQHLDAPQDYVAIRVRYSGPILDIPKDMAPRDVEAHLWRGAVWRWEASKGRTVFGAAAAAAAGRLGHLARLVPVMRMPGDLTDEGESGKEAAIGRMSVTVQHPATHTLHAPTAVSTLQSGRWPMKRTTSSFSFDCGSRASVLPANAGWILLPHSAMEIYPMGDIEAGDEAEVHAAIHLPEIDREKWNVGSAQKALAAALAAEEVVTSSSRSRWLSVVVLSQLAHALRSAAPENIVYASEVRTIGRATAMCALQWRNHELQRLRPTPWLLEAMAAYMADANPECGIGSALAADDRQERALEDLAAIDNTALAKGVAVLRMLARLTGEQTFRQNVLRGDTPLTAEDLAQRVEWRASRGGICVFPFTVNALNADVAPAEFVLPWATHPSLPVVVVDYEDEHLLISQMPMNPAAAGAIWPIPIIVYAAKRTADTTMAGDLDVDWRIMHADVLIERPFSIPVASKTTLRLLNAGRAEGFYRVHYTARAVRSGLFSFDPTGDGGPEAAEDAFALALHRRISIDESLAVVQATLAATWAAVPGARLGVMRFVRANLDALHLALRGDARSMRRRLRDLTRDIVRAIMALRYPQKESEMARASSPCILEVIGEQVPVIGKEAVFMEGNDTNSSGSVSHRSSKKKQMAIHTSYDSRSFETLNAPRNSSNPKIAWDRSPPTLIGNSGSSEHAYSRLTGSAAKTCTSEHSSGSGSENTKPSQPDTNAMHKLRVLSRDHRRRMAASPTPHQTVLLRKQSGTFSNPLSPEGETERRSGKAMLAQMPSMEEHVARRKAGPTHFFRNDGIDTTRDFDEEMAEGLPYDLSLVSGHKPFSDEWLESFEDADTTTKPPLYDNNINPEIQRAARAFNDGSLSFEDPLLSEDEEIWSHLGGGKDENISDDEHLSRLLFGMRLQTGDVAAVATAQRLFEAHVAGVSPLSSYADAAATGHDVRNELLDDVMRAASIYGDRRAWLEARDLSSGWRRPGDALTQRVVRYVSEQVREVAASVLKDPKIVPRAAVSHVMWWVMYNLWMAKAFFAFPTWQYLKVVSAYKTPTADVWTAWDKYTTDAFKARGYAAGCHTEFDPAHWLLPYLALYVFRYFNFLVFCVQSYYAIGGQAEALRMLSDTRAMRRDREDWARTAHERADPAAWIDAQVSFVRDVRTQSFPAESSYQARARAVDERRDELAELDNDWVEAGEQHVEAEEADDMFLPILRR